MYWGAKARFHDLQNVMIELKPEMVEFHLTDNDVRTQSLDEGTVHPTDYSIHLPEYWDGVMIDPCDLKTLDKNIEIYTQCIDKGLSLWRSFVTNYKRMKVIIHPGGSTVDQVKFPTGGEAEKYKANLYARFNAFVIKLRSIPRFKDKIELLVENMPPFPWFYGGQYYSDIFCDQIEVYRYCKANGVGFCFDISHMGLYCNHTGKNLLAAIDILKPYMRQIHIADAEGTAGEGVSIGSGNIDFKKAIPALKNIDAAMIPEQMWGHKNNYAEFKKTIDVCNKYKNEGA